MFDKRCGIAVLILFVACAPASDKLLTGGEPWIAGDTLHIYLCCARGLQAGEKWHGYLQSQPEPFLWGVAYTGQYVLNFKLMTGIPFVPSLPCTLVFIETGGEL